MFTNNYITIFIHYANTTLHVYRATDGAVFLFNQLTSNNEFTLSCFSRRIDGAVYKIETYFVVLICRIDGAVHKNR